jgi:hypothetical protein
MIRRVVRGESAKTALADWAPPMTIFGFTKGQFSLVDLIVAVLDKVGPARLDMSTWTAATADVRQLDALIKSGRLTGLRLLVDASFADRQPLILQTTVECFGNAALRVCNNHAKFWTLTAVGVGVVCKTSMNLNPNLRFEDFDLSCDPGLHAFLVGVMDELWTQDENVRSKRQAMRAFPHQLEGDDENA